MRTPKRHRTVGSPVNLVASRYCAWALSNAGKEDDGMASLPSWVGRALRVSLLRNSCWRIGGYIAYEWDFWKATRMLSLKQLHTELLASAFPGDDRNTERRALIALIAEDLRDAELWPTAGRGPEAARPLAEWRDRYEGIDRHLRYSGTP